MWSFAFGAMIVYTTMIGETVPIVGAALFGEKTLLANRTAVLLLVSAFVFLPLSLVRNVSNLAKFSGCAMLGAFYCVIIIMVDTPLFEGEHNDGVDRSVTFANRNVFPAIGIFAGALVCHHNVFIVYESLSDKSPARWNKVAHISMAISLSVLLLTSLCGYFSYGTEIKGNVLRNLPDNVAAHLARMASAVLLALTYPIENLVARECLEELLFSYSGKVRNWLKADNAELGAGLSCKKPSHDQTLFLIITLVQVVSSTLIGLFAPNSGVVFELVGGFSAVCLAFILPAACALKLQPERRLTWRRIPQWLLMIFGVIAMAASTGTSFVNIVTGNTAVSVGARVLCFSFVLTTLQGD